MREQKQTPKGIYEIKRNPENEQARMAAFGKKLVSLSKKNEEKKEESK